MFLNFRRSPVKYIFLWIFTLSFYHFIFRRQVVEDVNKICPDEKLDEPGISYYILYLLTLGIYGVIYDLKIISRLENYLDEREVYHTRLSKKHIIMGAVPFIRIIALPSYFKIINSAAKIYSDAQFEYGEEDEEDGIPLALLRRKQEEKKKHDEEHEVAGVQIVAEYDFDKDQRRVFHEEEKTSIFAAPEVEEVEEPVEEPEEDVEGHYRNKHWFKRVFAAMLAVFMLPFLTILVTAFALPPVYANTFVGELGEKYDRLCSIDEPKIVVIGGSSVAFGLDSKMMEEHLGMPVVNFGLYANLGTKLMMDLSRANINEGDIIILAPEMNDQTLSLYFNSETTAQALDGNLKMLFNIDSDQYESLIGATWKFTSDKLSYIITGTRPENSGAYMKENFNEYGDNMYDRPYNTMTSIQNEINLDFRTNYVDTINSDYEQYIEYVNKYVAFARKRGAEVYFSFPPMSDAAIAPSNDKAFINAFYKNLCSSLGCKVISSVEDYILDDGYFFDSEFHLNNAGVVVRTVRLIDDIKREKGILTITMPESELPEPPGRKPVDIVEGDDENLYFILELASDANGEYYKIKGINDEGKKQTELTIPNNVDGIPVRVLDTDALNGCTALEKLYIGDNITAISGAAFRGATALTAVYIPDGTSADKISVPNKMSEFLITEGCNPAVKIYVDQLNYEAFASDYFWGDYGGNLVKK